MIYCVCVSLALAVESGACVCVCATGKLIIKKLFTIFRTFYFYYRIGAAGSV